MKVALVIEWLDAWRGGAETSTEQFVRHLLNHNVDLTVFTQSRLSPTPDLRVHTIRVRTPARSRQSALFARRAAAAIRSERFDIVHAISPCLAADVYQPRGGTVAETVLRNLAIRPPGLRRVVKRAANSLNLKQRVILKFERELLGGQRRPIVLALSDYVVSQLREHYAYPEDRIRKVFNGVDPDRSDPATRRADRADIRKLYRIRDDDLLVLMVAHNFKLKGLRRWLDALGRLVRDTDLPIRALVVGKDDSPVWERMVAREGLSERVQFTGSTRRIGAFFHAADVLVHPTYYDPCSRVVLEALTSGLPVITTRYDGAAEVIEDGVNGLVAADSADGGSLAECVLRLANPRERARMGAEALKVTDRVTMDRHVNGVYRVYQELIEEGTCRQTS